MHRWLKIALLGSVLTGLAACVPPQGQGGAEGGAEGGATSMLTTLLPLVLIFAVFYFLIIRPQQRKAKAHREMLSNIRRGDQVVSTGGIIGNVVRIDRDDNLQVEIAPGVRIKMARSGVQDVVQRPQPLESDAEDEDEDEDQDEQAARPATETDSDKKS